jgi:hypothetical protein
MAERNVARASSTVRTTVAALTASAIQAIVLLE